LCHRGGEAEAGHPAGAAAYRTEVWKRLVGNSSELKRGSCDFNFYIKAMEAGVPIVHCGGVFYRCRKGHHSHVSSYADNIYQSFEIMTRINTKFFADKRRRNRFLANG